ncbi:hypothetical protein [Catalinimonas alkaloidigena]|uniref:hypothetical protein n=1 Tax=Catalinimonas alkaloidigena TaxID=1075417 RepID=UPI002406ACB2|nr:hypothetical protein [Catalinimonas alkaloidigena]
MSLLALSFLFQACSEDDEVSREDLLTGTWTIQTSELTDYSITISGFTLTKETIQNTPFAGDAAEFEESLKMIADDLFPPNTTITFNDDNTYVVTNQTSSAPDNWALSANEQELTIDIENDDIQSLVFTIEELSSSALQIVLTLDETAVDLEAMGGEELEVDDFTIEYTFSFTK